MTNKEWLLGLPDNQCWCMMDFILHKFGQQFTDTPHAVIKWLGEEFVEEQMKTMLTGYGYTWPGNQPEEERKGYWTVSRVEAPIGFGPNCIKLECSFCGKTTDLYEYDVQHLDKLSARHFIYSRSYTFCPHCGATMKKHDGEAK